jgi:uncharacterized repeat protein (TIGR01451 family)
MTGQQTIGRSVPDAMTSTNETGNKGGFVVDPAKPSLAVRAASRFAMAVAGIAVALAIAGGVAADAAVAAPALAIDSSHQRDLEPGGEGRYTISLGNVGDTATAGTVTITDTLPAGVTALSAADAFSFWACSIGSGGQTVTCTGPSGFGGFFTTIAPGMDACEGTGFGLPKCPIVIDVEVAPDVDEGVVTNQVEACGGGTATCASDSDRTRLYAPGAYGDRYGIASINDDPDAVEDVPALPGEGHAFWAGACDRGSATGVFGDLVPQGGVGARPTQILAPSATIPFQALVDAPATPDHCIDWGAQTLYTLQSQVWQSFPWGVSEGGTGQIGPGGSHAPRWRLPAAREAGSHPDGTTMFAWQRGRDGKVDGGVDNIHVDLPPGFVGNPQAVPECTAEEFGGTPLRCPAETQVGVLRLLIEAVAFGANNLGQGFDTTYPVYNLEPRKGRVAELGFGYASGEHAVTVRLTGKARTNGDYGVTAFTGQIPAALTPIAQSITLWGVPWAAENDIWRPKLGQFETFQCRQQPGATAGAQYIPPGGLQVLGGGEDCRERYDSSWGEIKPFLTNETDCDPAPTVRLATDSFQHPGAFTADGDPDVPAYPQLAGGGSNWKTYDSVSPSVTGCGDLDFEPDIDIEPTSGSADGPSGLEVGLSVPQNNEPPESVAHDPGDPNDPDAGAPGHWRSDAGRATAHLKDTVVTLPAGVSVNPSGATGLQGCSDAGIGVRGSDSVNGRLLFNNGDPFDKDAGDGAECPDGSKLGTVEVDTPLLSDPLIGEVVLGEPKSTNPASGDMLRMFIVARSEERGLIAKIYGSATADPQTGRLKATFKNNPEVPFDDLRLDFKGGQRGLLALPQRCGAPGWASAFTPWSGGAGVDDGGAFAVDSNCSNGFAPSLLAGMDTQAARGSGTFSFRFSRKDGEQYLRGLTARLPQGLLASVKDVPLCSNAQAGAGGCPAASKIGIVDAKAGSGDPFVLERKGEVFLTEGYKGGEYGLAVKIRPVAGPFRGSMELSPIVVRQAIHVDRTTAQVTAVSDPFPLIHHGVPLRVREVTVLVNRGGFMLNPSGCVAKRVAGVLSSSQGASSSRSNPFQASGCARLPFRPKLALRLTGKKQTRTGKHPGVRAVVKQAGTSEAGIERAEVRLPKSLALDPENAQALCEYVDGTRPDLENRCPKGSIVGRARAVSPLLKEPLVGNVYFVKNVRRSSTGNTIRTLPMIVVALRGEIAVNLRGESSTTRSGKLVNTFAQVPDAPIGQFNLNIRGGSNGILAVTRTRRGKINLCAGRHISEADIDGHNGRRADQNVRMKTPCPKAKRKASSRRR